MEAAEKRKLIAIMLLVGLLTALAVWRQESRRGESRALVPAPDTVASAMHRQEVAVSVNGAVAAPGLYRLPPNSRVAEAIEQAGGFLPEADQARVNLARRCTDGMSIQVPYQKPAPARTQGRRESGAPSVVDLNNASAQELAGLPGIGPELAQRIVIYREEHGGFRYPAQIKNVNGIGEAKFSQIKDRIKI